jgi:hypothetical protein
VLNTTSLYLAVCKLLEEYAPHLKLPFTYEQFFEIVQAKIIEMCEVMSQNNKLGDFFNTMVYMLGNRQIISGRDFKIEYVNSFVAETNKGKETIVFERPTKVLFIQISNIHKSYLKHTSDRNPISGTTFRENLKSYPAYIGKQDGTRFRWKEVKEAESNPLNPGSAAMKTLVQKQIVTSSFVLNYEELVRLLGVDLEFMDYEEKEPTAEERFENEIKEVILELPF